MKSGQISVLDTTEEWYNAYEKDIAVANFYYSKPTSIGKCIFIDILYSNNNYSEYRRTVNMGPIDFVSQLGGLFGLCLGFSLISFIEIFYWFSIRLFRNCVTQRSRKDSELSKIEAEFRKMKAKEFADNSFNVIFSGHSSISSVSETLKSKDLPSEQEF